MVGEKTSNLLLQENTTCVSEVCNTKGQGLTCTWSHDILGLNPFRVLRTVSRVADRNKHNKVDSRLTLYKYYFYKCKNNVSQYGFRAEYSTELALPELMDRIDLDLDENRLPIAILVNLSKAFYNVEL